jgi:hypothetical protein
VKGERVSSPYVTRTAKAPSPPVDRGSPGAREPLDVVPWTPPAPFPFLEVRNPAHQTRYCVALPEFPERRGALCSCEDFARRGKGTCKHIEAAWVAVRSRPPEAIPPLDPEWLRTVWAEVDRRAYTPREGRWPGPRELRASGRVVCEATDPYRAPGPTPEARRPAGDNPGGRSRSRPAP